MGAVSVDIKDLLVAESSLGLTFSTDLFVGREPSDVANCVTIFDTGGGPPQLTVGINQQNEFYEYPSIQIRVKNTSYVTGYNLANTVIETLHGRAGDVFNGSLYTVIYCANGPALLDWNENNKVRFIMNFNLQRRSV